EMKATYGTGSSVVMQTGEQLVRSSNGLVTSIAWDFNGKVSYILEGNINYSGAVVTWLIDDLHLIHDPGEAEDVARRANPADHAVFVPAFTGLGAPWWDGDAEATARRASRAPTGRNEIVRAVLDSIPLQDTSLVRAMRSDRRLPRAGAGAPTAARAR
ncbi:protein containing Carbohydrate kinase, FGGY, partial [gut metagenome]